MSINPLELFFSRLKEEVEEKLKMFTPAKGYTDSQVLEAITKYLDDRGITTITAQQLYDTLYKTPDAITGFLIPKLEDLIGSIPTTSSTSIIASAEVGIDVWTNIGNPVEGAGYVDFIYFDVVPGDTNSHKTFIKVLCDGAEAFKFSFDLLEMMLAGPCTPTISLMRYGENGVCIMLIHKTFGFKKKFQLQAYNGTDTQSVGAIIHSSLIR